MFSGIMVGGHVSQPPFSHPDHKTHSHQGSDLMGRITAFNATLFFTALFGLLTSFSKPFSTLCIALFFLGSLVGVRRSKTLPILFSNSFRQGSMPTDGTPYYNTCRKTTSTLSLPFLRFFLSWPRAIGSR